ncbi:uncharacterized protein LOC132945295 [Metopolophium dirhodum]|uniref:uncharacterized protein LOC132945295 n=1 Tax=Metopolophium dirhodum TaxID=44670 RepID=UPI0029908037|nr:uncharacterized protein LOC132945295 [Metopolophium dirhodum]XP_060870980.1 uncharacterized protein LOC132945295 [Metopolophium dirhodum]XP_060870981.1 uncharacterized protein LOC132945295 [Metopolophium dirhodum]
MTFRYVRLMVSVMALATHLLAAPSSRPQPQTVKSTEDQTVRNTLLELVGALMIGGASVGGRKTEVHHHNDGQSHKPQHHQAISTLIHLLLTIGSAFAPLVGAIVGPLLTNVANGITWAISHTIASGFSPPHGLFSPELGHGTDHIKEHLTSYAVEGQPETGSDAIHQVQQPAAVLEQSEPATVDDTRNEVKKIV